MEVSAHQNRDTRTRALVARRRKSGRREEHGAHEWGADCMHAAANRGGLETSEIARAAKRDELVGGARAGGGAVLTVVR